MALSHQWLETLPSPQGVLEKVQRNGRESLKKHGLPTKDLEAWRLTDIKRIENLLTLPLPPEKKETSMLHSHEWAIKPNHGLRIVLDTQNNSFESLKLPDGLQILTSEELQIHLENNLQQLSSNNEWPLAINQAATKKVLALRIKGKDLPPLELIMPAEKDTLTPTRVILVVEEKVKLELLQIALGSGCSAHSHVLEIHLGKEAELNHGFVALGGGKASCLANLTINQEPCSNYSLTSVQHGWSISRLEPHIIQLNGQGNTTLKGLQVSTAKQQLATHSIVNFEGPEGYLNQLQKGAASQNSHSIFNGVINVPQRAQRTNASQLSRNLLLSNYARIDTKPELEIVADDVRCAHGATVSQLKEDELFYLRSRGIDSKQAASLLLKGYYQEIIEALPIEANRWGILNTILESENL